MACCCGMQHLPPSWRLGCGRPEITPDVELLVLEIHREEIEAGAVGRVASELMELSESPQLRRQLAHGVLFICGGYDHDPREIWQIPEICKFLSALAGQWNYFLHFLAPLPDFWAVLLLALADGQLEAQASARSCASADPAVVAALLDSMRAAAHLLHRDMQLSPEQSAAVLQRSAAAIEACFK